VEHISAVAQTSSKRLTARKLWGMMGLSPIPILATAIPAGGLLVVVAVLGVVFEMDVSKLMRDPGIIIGFHPLTGVVSNLGVLVWSGATWICLFSALVARVRRMDEAFAFTLCAGLLSIYLTFDDLFMLHDDLLQRYLGVSESLLYVFLGMATLAFLIRFRRFILRTDFGFLLLALGFLGLSVFVDSVVLLFVDRYYVLVNTAEDGFKWLGIAFWCCYYARTCYQMIVDPERFTVAAAA
jgi:hypothetical protein